MQTTPSSPTCRGCANCPSPGTTCGPQPGSLEARVVAVAERVLGHPIPAGPDMLKASFVQDLGADSLDLVELVMYMEDEFGVEVPDEVATRIHSLQDAVNHIQLVLGYQETPGREPTFPELFARIQVPPGSTRGSNAVHQAIRSLSATWKPDLSHLSSTATKEAMRADLQEAIELLRSLQLKLA